MKVFKHISELKSIININKTNGNTIGFVPTMGALHFGHLSLIKKAKEDLKKYPRDISKDIKLLEDVLCDYLFFPSVDEMYPNSEQINYNFGHLDKIMEGKHRPGHFNGVATIVKKLFEIIEPHNAYFGEKDFQQLLIIKKLKEIYKLNVNIKPFPIIREKDGLAMSSRNLRLSEQGRKIAPNIFKILNKAKAHRNILTVAQTKEFVYKEISNFQEMNIEYFEIANAENLLSVDNWSDTKTIIGCIVVNIDKIRLIHNIIF